MWMHSRISIGKARAERWVDRMEHQRVPTAAETSTIETVIGAKLEVQVQICTFSMVLKADPESDLTVWH